MQNIAIVNFEIDNIFRKQYLGLMLKYKYEKERERKEKGERESERFIKIKIIDNI